jgi:hypothetical protein
MTSGVVARRSAVDVDAASIAPLEGDRIVDEIRCVGPRHRVCS